MDLQIFACPNCDQAFQVEGRQTGQQVRCPGCRAVVRIPQVNSAAFPALSDAGRAADPLGPGVVAPNVLAPPIHPTPYHCPSCAQVFGVVASMCGTAMACPHCAQVVEINLQHMGADGNSGDKGLVERPEVSIDVLRRAAASKLPIEKLASDVHVVIDQRVEAVNDLPNVAEPFVAESVDHLLPPRFEALDPDFFCRIHRDSAQVLLPAADGSVTTVSNRIVTVVHNGKEYRLVSSPRYRRILNAVSTALLMVLAAILILAIYWTGVV